MTPESFRAAPLNWTWIAAFWAAIASTVLGTVYVSLHKGIWYDEIWPVFMGQHDLSFGRAYAERWVYDDYPPMFYAANWLLEPLTGDSVGYRRLINLLPLALVGLALVLIVRRRRDLALPIMLAALLGLTNPIGFDFAVLLRAYFGQVCAWFLCLACLLAIGTGDRDYERGDRGLALVLAAAIFVSLNLHYLLSLQSGLSLGCFIVAEWLAGRRGWAVRIFAMTALSSVTLIGTAMIQLRLLSHMAATYWAQTTTVQALGITGFALMLIWGANLAALVALAVTGGRRAQWGPTLRDSGAARFAVVSAIAILVCLAAMLLFNVVRPVIIRQYMAPVFPLGEVALAVLIAPAVQRYRWLFALILANALLIAAGYSWRRAKVQDWNTNAAFIGAQVRACSGTHVLSIPFWTMRGQSESSLLHNEVEVAHFGFRQLGDRYGFKPEFRIRNAEATLPAERCPTIVWSEHYYPPGPSAAEVARIAGLMVSSASVQAAVVHNSSSGFAVVYPPIGPR